MESDSLPLASAPGLRFVLFKILPGALFGDVGTYFLQRAIQTKYLNYRIPGLVFWFNILFGWVILLVATRVVWKTLSRKLDAKRIGAVLPPTWKGSLPGNFDPQVDLFKKFLNGYPG